MRTLGGVPAPSAAAVAVVAAGFVQAFPAATWIPAVRRHVPSLWGLGDADHVALSFDDGPDPVSTPAFLEMLGALGVRATFFVVGERAARHPDLVHAIADAGHEIGLHGWTHRYGLWARPRLGWCIDATVAVSGQRPVWFRPPYGVLSLTSAIEARRCGLRPVLWSAWGRDWRAQATRESVLDDLAPGLVGGGTLLLHESGHTCSADAWRTTLAALPDVVGRCEERGLRVGPLADHGIGQAISRPLSRP
jgi:peptidoglycan/xylan/chitin deacetylase (PgdA/CDA1 family)